jgi:hypothetical protein
MTPSLILYSNLHGHIDVDQYKMSIGLTVFSQAIRRIEGSVASSLALSRHFKDVTPGISNMYFITLCFVGYYLQCVKNSRPCKTETEAFIGRGV